MSRTPFICGNWKLHKTISESIALAKAVAEGTGDLTAVEVGIAPVFTAIHGVRKALGSASIRVGGQNCLAEGHGAFTGELSPPLLRDAGCDFVIVGHSERRQLFGETDEGVNAKVKALLHEGLTPIVCVGETIDQRQAGQTFDLVRLQLRGALVGLTPEQVGSVVVAYEPVWAIGTGLTASTEQAQEVHADIRALLRELADVQAENVRIQYGGSVKPANAQALLSQPDIDGALVGGASLVAEDFIAIVRAAK